MSYPLPSPLPLFDRTLLRAVEKVVPVAEREEWTRAWEAELWHMQHRGNRTAGVTADLSIGLTRDALWLRTDSWRRIFGGTTTLCLVSLCGLLVLCMLIALDLSGSWHSLGVALRVQFKRFLFEAPLVVFVTFANASRRYIEQSSMNRKMFWMKRQIFFGTKTLLTLLLTFLLSADVCLPIPVSLPNTADFCQTVLFVVFAVFGLRWAFSDQEQRCKQCLRSLAMPARVGRPSHNLLEWNGTELVCKQGHGLLSVPEMETSWCESSRWVERGPGWGQTASL